jgi:hypothetical protein
MTEQTPGAAASPSPTPFPPATAPEPGATGAGRPGNDLVTVAAYRTYAEAERAVDYLSDHKFPVERTAIAGRGLSTIEHVTGRLTFARAAAQSALLPAVLGALFGWLFGLLNWIDPLVSGLLLALYGAIFGAILGALLGLLAHALSGGRRDFTSVSGLKADHYEVLVDVSHADEARALLQAEGGPGPGDASTRFR